MCLGILLAMKGGGRFFFVGLWAVTMRGGYDGDGEFGVKER